MRLREVEEAEKKQMMKERQQKLLEGQLVRIMCLKISHTESEDIAHHVYINIAQRVLSLYVMFCCREV